MTADDDPTRRVMGVPETGPGTLVAFCDASNDADKLDGLCQYGYVLTMASGPVIYHSKKLKHVSPNGAVSYCEYMALCMCNQAVVWLRQLLLELGEDELLNEPTIVYGDNRSANTLCVEDIVTAGNMYILLPYHWNKEVVQHGYVQIRDCKTAYNIADLFTKPVPAQKIRELLAKLCGYAPVDFAEIDKGFFTSDADGK
ncbi:MAG: Ty1/Copia family ribonuclease HI [Pirellulales bacterium]|nr:Ty1/Copia family ribonuclease HI [Pirellulales bacterium]